jgi:hypothetical protein
MDAREKPRSGRGIREDEARDMVRVKEDRF